MGTGRRVKQLQDMMRTIERLPASPERDRLLSEVRSRAVDVDTGETPRAVLPMREPTPPPLSLRVVKREPSKVIRQIVPRAPAPRPVGPTVVAAPAETLESSSLPEGNLSLDDATEIAPLPYVRVKGNRTVPPWTLGLRG